MRNAMGPQYFDGGTDWTPIVPPKVITLYTNTALVEGDAVMIDLATASITGIGTVPLGTVVKQFTGAAADRSLLIGGVYKAAAGAGLVEIQVEGIQANVNLTAAVALGSPLVGSSAAAGRLDIYPAAFSQTVGPIVGISYSVVTANKATVKWLNPHAF